MKKKGVVETEQVKQYKKTETAREFLDKYSKNNNKLKKSIEQFIEHPKETAFVDSALFITRNIPNGLEKVLKGIKKFDKNDSGLSQIIDWTLEHREGPYTMFERLFNSDKDYVKTFIYNFMFGTGVDWINECKKAKEEGRFQPPFALLINPSWRCNLDCSICWAKSYLSNKNEDIRKAYNKKDIAIDMEPEFLDDIITQAEEMGTHFFTLLGGEPSLLFRRPGYREVLLNHPKSEFQFFTNATTLDDYTIDYLNINKNMIPVISIDGNEEETDAIRGKGAYKKVVNGMERLKEEKIPYGVSLVLTNKNYETLTDKKFYDWLIDKGAIFSWTFVCMPVGMYPSIEDMPKAEQRLNYGRFIKKYREENPLFAMDFWNDAPAVNGCIAARKYAQVIPSGDVEPCVFAHFSGGNLHEKSLKDIWENSPLFNAIRLRQPIDNDLLLPCMIIDHPDILRDHYQRYKPKVTDFTSQKIIENLADVLDEYSKEVREKFDEYWYNTDMWKKYKAFIEKENKGTTEGFDRIWFENLPEEEKNKVLKELEEKARQYYSDNKAKI